MHALLEEKTLLEERLPQFRKIMVDYELGAHHALLDFRRRAQRHSVTRRQLQEKLAKQRQKLERAESRRASESTLVAERKALWELETPVQEMEAFYDCRYCDAKRDLQHALEGIEEIEQYYRERKRLLKEEYRQADQRRIDCRRAEVEWALQSHEHLQWVMARAPQYREELLQRGRMLLLVQS